MVNIVRPKTFGQVYAPVLERLDRRAAGIEKPVPMPPMWSHLSKEMDGGWWPGSSYVFVGNPASGKSQFCLQAAIHAASKGVPVLYISLELDIEQVFARIAGAITGLPWSAIYLGLDQGVALEQAKTSPLIQVFREAPFYISVRSQGEWQYEGMEPLVAYMRELHPDTAEKTRPMLVILDYLQIVDSLDTKLEMRERIKKASYHTVHVAQKYNAAPLLISSTAVNNYALLSDKHRLGKEKNLPRPGEGPAERLMGVGKESGDIEYSAGNLLVLTYNDGSNIAPGPDYDVTTIKNKGVHYIALAKRRSGQPCWVMAGFEPKSGVFHTTQSTFGITIDRSKKGRKKKDEDDE